MDNFDEQQEKYYRQEEAKASLGKYIKWLIILSSILSAGLTMGANSQMYETMSLGQLVANFLINLIPSSVLIVAVVFVWVSFAGAFIKNKNAY